MENYQENIQKELLRVCLDKGLLDNNLLQSPDIDEKWRQMAPDFLADAVPEFNGYPEVVLAWAAYLGAAIAYGWDTDWDSFKNREYSFFCGEKGFDYMDEHITEDILGYPLGSEQADELAKTLSYLASAAYSRLQHSGAEGGTADAYQAVISTIDAMFSMGAAIMLRKLGYKYESYSK